MAVMGPWHKPCRWLAHPVLQGGFHCSRWVPTDILGAPAMRLGLLAAGGLREGWWSVCGGTSETVLLSVRYLRE